MHENIALELLTRHRDFEHARPVVDVPGLSSAKVCAFLNQLVANMDPEEHYLEIGTFQGRTLLSAAYGNRDRRCVACDRFRFWGKFTGPGFVARRRLLQNLKRYEDRCAEIRFFDMSHRRLFEQSLVPSPVGVFFYDGDHSYRETRFAIVAASRTLSRRSVLLMDDFNDPEVVRATRDGLQEAGLRPLWQRVLPGDHGPSGWWNGLGVFYVERP